MAKRIFDISQTLREGIPVWPGDAEFKIIWNDRISDVSPVNVGEFHLSAHTGSHGDAPFHYSRDGASPADLDLTPYLGLCQLIDARQAGDLVRPGDIEDRLLTRAERVLIRSFEAFPHDEWDSNFTAVDPATIDMLAARGCLLIGLDAPSLDPEASKTLEAHQRVLAHDMRVLEGLVLDGVPEGVYELIALPLKLATADSSPVRAVLREL